MERDSGAGGVREEGVEGAGSRIPKVAGIGGNRGKLRNIVQYFAIEKRKEKGAKKIGREPGLKCTGSGKLNPLPPPLFSQSFRLLSLSAFRERNTKFRILAA